MTTRKAKRAAIRPPSDSLFTILYARPSGIRPGREDLEAVLGHRDGVLPLGRERVVLGDHRPAVRQLAGLRLAGVDHRLGREGQAPLSIPPARRAHGDP